MERFLNGFGIHKDFERKVHVSLAPEARGHLRGLVMRPNPNLEEFAFLGLGRGSLIDRILTADRKDLEKQGLKIENGLISTGVGADEVRLLFKKLKETEGSFDILLLGHLHPSGAFLLNGKPYYLSPRADLLVPSMGSPEEGGPTGSSDLKFFKELHEKVVKIPFMGIVANMDSGPRLRLYKTDKLIKIKRYNDIDKVPQTTIDLQ